MVNPALLGTGTIAPTCTPIPERTGTPIPTITPAYTPFPIMPKIQADYQDMITGTFLCQINTGILHVRQLPVYGSPVRDFVFDGETITVTQVVSGWGLTQAGFIKMEFCKELNNER